MIVELVIAAGIGGIALLLARRELAIYRARRAADSDVFVYSKWRLARRLTGIAVLASTAITLVAWVLIPPTTAGGASAYITLFMCEVEKENAPAAKATGAPKKNKKKATAGRGRRKRSRARRPR